MYGEGMTDQPFPGRVFAGCERAVELMDGHWDEQKLTGRGELAEPPKLLDATEGRDPNNVAPAPTNFP